MGRLLNLFVDICLFRAGPQALPASGFLAWLAALVNLVTGTLVIVGMFPGPGDALLAQMLDLLLTLALLRAALTLLGKRGRLVQTLSALFGAGSFINLVTMPLQITAGEDPSVSLFGELAAMLYLVLILWALAITAHILRHAFEIRFGTALLVAIGYFFMVNWLIQILFFGTA